MYGVSPAFIFSRYGKDFGISDFSAALKEAASLGYEGYQGEVFHEERLGEWSTGGARAVHDVATSLGMTMTQFVAHFMLKYFSRPEHLDAETGKDSLRRVVEIAKTSDWTEVLTVPMAALEVDWNTVSGPNWYADVRKRLHEKLAGFLHIVVDAGLRMAVEILPYSVMGGMAGFQEVCRVLDSPDLGINLDTGHAWVSGEIVPLLPFLLQDRIFGVHLSDNDGTVNKSLAPGRGTIDWVPLLDNLASAGYTGSLDIEIACEANEVIEAYREGKAYLESCLEQCRFYQPTRVTKQQQST